MKQKNTGKAVQSIRTVNHLLQKFQKLLSVLSNCRLVPLVRNAGGSASVLHSAIISTCLGQSISHGGQQISFDHGYRVADNRDGVLVRDINRGVDFVIHNAPDFGANRAKSALESPLSSRRLTAGRQAMVQIGSDDHSDNNTQQIAKQWPHNLFF